MLQAATPELEPIYSTLQSEPEFAELLAVFAGEMPRRATAIELALAQRDHEEVRRVAHQLKGAASSYGFEALTNMAGQLEHAVRDQETPEAIGELAARLAAMCRRVAVK